MRRRSACSKRHWAPTVHAAELELVKLSSTPKEDEKKQLLRARNQKGNEPVIPGLELGYLDPSGFT
jgi:hypothetical protein